MATKYNSTDAKIVDDFASFQTALAAYNTLEGDDLDNDAHPFREAWNEAYAAMDSNPLPTSLAAAVTLLRYGIGTHSTTKEAEEVMIFGNAKDRQDFIASNWDGCAELRPYLGALSATERLLVPTTSDEFEAALCDYQTKRALSDAIPLGTAGEDEALETYCVAMDHLIEEVPAPTLAAVLTKFELARERGVGHNDGLLPDHRDALLADLQRLALAEQSNPLGPVAAAWIDRWQALGGNFGTMYNPDGTEAGPMRGMPMPDVWTPPEQHNPALAPHEWIVEESHHAGAVKMLESFLTLVPGLREAVRAMVDTNGLRNRIEGGR